MSTNLANTPSPELSSVKIDSSQYEMNNFIKLFLGIIILSLLGYNLYTYLYYGLDMFGNVIGESAGNLKNVNKTVKSINSTVDDTLTTTHNIVKDTTGISVNNNLDNSLKYRKKHSESAKPDKINSSIQNNQKNKYCFVGLDQGARSCVKLDESDRCLSGKIFPTKDICINPALRV
jgi:hypothetical protein